MAMPMGWARAKGTPSPAGQSRCKRRTGLPRRGGRCGSAVLPFVLDVDALAQRRVNGAIAVAGQVDRLVNRLPVEVTRPSGDERDVDLGEAARPLLLLLTLDVDLQRRER